MAPAGPTRNRATRSANAASWSRVRADRTNTRSVPSGAAGRGDSASAYSSTTRWMFAPPAPKELTPARRGTGPSGPSARGHAGRDECRLCVGIRHGVPAGLAARVGEAGPDDAPDPVAVGDGPGQRFEQNGTDAFAGYEAVGARVEHLAPPVGREHVEPAERDEVR